MKTKLIFLFAILTVPVFAQEKTLGQDKQAKAMLLGRHKLSLQWISWDYFGIATVTERAGVMAIKGEQRGRGRENTDFVTVEGTIVSIDKSRFILQGKIITRVSHINGGKPCERSGDFTFKITGKRKYWRMQEMNNPCDEAADHVDIYFR